MLSKIRKWFQPKVASSEISYDEERRIRITKKFEEDLLDIEVYNMKTQPKGSYTKRKLGNKYPTTLETVSKKKLQAIIDHPAEYVEKTLNDVQEYKRKNYYLFARDEISVLISDAVKYELSLPDNINELKKQILIDGAIAFLKEYRDTHDELSLSMAKNFAEEARISFSTIEGMLARPRIEY